MNDFSIGAVGAAIIAGLISLISLVVGKEQKVSEFRQAWIDSLRKSMIAYLVNINAIADVLKARQPGAALDSQALISHYKLLNEARNDIVLRVNMKEKKTKKLLESMENFEKISQSNATLTAENIRNFEKEFINSSKKLLKFEWNRVKRGERAFFWTKWISVTLIALAITGLGYMIFSGGISKNSEIRQVHTFRLENI